MFIREVNRESTANVNCKGANILCLLCNCESTVVSRRNSKWISLCYVEVLEVSKDRAYPACSHCKNALPHEFTICRKCRHIIHKPNTECEECR
ncbi:uncharacterized protein NEMAJ01_2067 [Nematocida major]|uniref:uncharacterized protein n=1 Tax=Nematocida major TaxID=1912982 RepID=UPI002007E965|nr:uncharacterized protein NEMAJ01_2067 [Nematocida major]KAH9387171.1 hypothetical protein NEMAJ01_2067 [Nematocida major]